MSGYTCIKLKKENMYNLNSNQELAVKCRKNLLIVAGAGTGKTKTLVSKISYYIEQGFILPHQVIATTFTNKAAHEMKKRLEDNLGNLASMISIGTFHKLSLNIVQENAEILGFKSVQVLPYDDQLQLIRKIIGHMKYKALKPSQLLEMLQRAKEKDVFDGLGLIERDILDIYQKRLKDMNAVDFADLLANTIKLWEANPEILEKYREQYKLICIDEYQDINEAQHRWLKLLCGDNNQICCVGDPDQAIYAFRGSDIKYILSFHDEFKNSEKVILDQNYRSTDKIIHNANSLIKHNKSRIEKNLIANTTSHRNVDVFIGMHEREESVEICKLIAKEKSENPNATIAVLFRTSSQMDSMEESLLNANIKYSIVGSIQLLDRAEVKDIISYVRFFANTNDLMAFNRLMQAPKSGIGQTTLDKIGNADGDSVKEKIENLQSSLNAGTYQKLQDIMGKWDKWRTLNLEFPVLMEKIVHESGLFESLEKHRQENIVRWLDSITDFKNAEEYVNYVLWSNIKSDDDNDVQLMTVHAAKGLEFDVVFLPGWEEGLFPHIRSRANTEEERRLAYVALTRAKSYLAISYAQSRMQHGRYASAIPSRFLRELDSKTIVFKSFKQKGMIGKKVFHDVFGYGIVEETGANHAQIAFGSTVKVVPLDSLIECQ
ncbi:ATP-dependent helicase [Candidatus Cytomitobacter primus]|uniref:DNA 3'-5' helicase n=1 Tax=Candidatus Cytomitobacter primus TaxID=2066024 RepID=A0A5C0UHG0_9PROT|nr:UvrD-helicase domain-containing protein [Candidatus Cytomitobacter primus]QEK38762.1 AAA family ATPase [Candidatus Cytomitobacter primus]